LGDKLDLSWSRDVIGHVTIRFGIGYFLLVVIWNHVSLSLTVSEIFCTKLLALMDTMLNRHCACIILRDMYPCA